MNEHNMGGITEAGFPLPPPPPLYKNAADITPRTVPWLIDEFMVRGALNGIRGLPNSGKSWLTCFLAKEVADGGSWLGDSGNMVEVQQGRVLIANFDDDAAYTIKPRLLQCGVENMQDISILDRAACVDLTFGDERLAEIFGNINPDLAIFDTLQHFIGATADMSRANQMNAVLVHLQRLAEKHNTAVVLVEHIGKQAANGQGGHSLNWGIGSVAIPGLLRTAWTVGELRGEEHEPGTKAIVCSKYNLLKSAPPARLFRIDSENGGLIWRGVDDKVSAFDLIAPDKKRSRGRPAEQSERAERIILDTLAANGGQMLSEDLKNAVVGQGISERTYNAAKKAVGVKSFQSYRQWYVRLQKIEDTELLQFDLSEHEHEHESADECDDTLTLQ